MESNLRLADSDSAKYPDYLFRVAEHYNAMRMNQWKAGMALHDVWLWKQQAGDSLPGSAATGGGDVTVAFDDTVVPPLYTITVSWEEPGITDLDAPPSYVVTIPVNPF